MKKITLLIVLMATILTTSSANFSFMGDMIRDMTNAAKEMKTDTVDVAKDIKTDGIDVAKEIKSEGIDGFKDMKNDLSDAVKDDTSDINSKNINKSKELEEEAKK